MEDEILQIQTDAWERLALVDEMESAGLPEQLDQDARDLVRIILDHGEDYTDTQYGDMTTPLLRSLARLVKAATPVAP